jgi:hypothetical protein
MRIVIARIKAGNNKNRVGIDISTLLNYKLNTWMKK